MKITEKQRDLGHMCQGTIPSGWWAASNEKRILEETKN